MSTPLAFDRRSLSTTAQILCGLAHPDEDLREVESIMALAGEEIEWDALVAAAKKQRIAPLVYKNIQRVSTADVPPTALAVLEAYYHANIRNALVLRNELVRIIASFRQAGVAAVPLKGPVLEARAYADFGLRTYGDLDLLVRRPDFPRAKQVLGQAGYLPFRNMGKREERRFLNTQMGYEFVRSDDGLVVEVHWGLLNVVHAFQLDTDRIWNRRTSILVDGSRVPTLSAEDTLLYLCAHGGKHCWDYLQLVADVARVVHVMGKEIDWAYVRDAARRLNMERVVYLGIALANDLLGHEASAWAQPGIRLDPSIGRLIETATNWMFGQVDPDADARLRARFHLTMRERIRDRLPYIRHLLKLNVQPSDRDREAIGLPHYLSFIYYLVRPVRVTTAKIKRWLGLTSDRSAAK